MRKPLPIKISTLGSGAGAGHLSPDDALLETQRLVARANKRALEEMGRVVFLPRQKKRMNDTDRMRYVFEHGRWPSASEQRGD